MNRSPSLPYRPEIDGLRALAVLPVILYHAGVPGFGGGFVGVDVFFVISGYLITRLLLRDLDGDTFSLLTFYERRARRILPALLAVVIVSTAVAMMWMLPHELKDYAQSLVAVALFASNVLFWRETDYFAPAAEEKPLLHTWSLAVEEQYYLAFPIFLMLAWRFGRSPVFWTIATIAGLSLVAAEISVRIAPGAAFYLPHARVWELLAGSLCAFAHHRREWDGNSLLAALGLAMIAGAVVLFDGATPTPSLWTLIPVGGAVLVVLFARGDVAAARALSLPPLVGIGLVSYSAYLWHYPMFAFARLRGLPVENVPFMLALSVLSLVVAWLSWRMIEQPFRKGRHATPLLPRRWQVFAASGVAGFAVVAAGVAGATTSLRYDRFPPEIASVLRQFDDFRPAMRIYGLETCFMDYHQTADTLFENACLAPHREEVANVVLFGDSHAAHLSYGIDAHLPPSAASFSHYSGTECAPFVHPHLMARCRDALARFLAAMEASPPRTVVMSSNWLESYEREGETAFLNAVAASLAKLQAAGHDVVLVLQSPTYRRGGWLREIAIRGEIAWDAFSRSDDFRPVNAALAELARERGLKTVDPTDLLCRPQSLSCRVTTADGFVFTDRAHVTPPISHRLGELVVQALEDERRVAVR